MADASIVFDVKFDSKNFNNGVSKLNKKLESIGKSTSKLADTQKKAFSGSEKSISSMNKSLITTSKLIGAALIAGLGKLVKSSTQTAMQVESSMANISYTMGENSKHFLNWVNTQAKGFAISKTDAYKYGSTYSNLISSFTTDTGKLTADTQKLMEVTAIVSSKTGRTFEDTADRIRSGMLGSTEAIEDLGIYTQTSMLESTKAFREFAGDKSWKQLDFQTQQQIRLAAIMEQAYGRYGTELANTTQTSHNIFIASLGNLKLAFGQAFLPIYDFILPALTRLVDAMTKVLTVFKVFTGALFGNSKRVTNPFTEQSKALDSSAQSMSGFDDSMKNSEKSAKKLKKSLQGFDQLNIMQDNSDTGSGSTPSVGPIGVGGGSGPVFPEISGSEDAGLGALSTKVEAFANKIRETFGKISSFIKENKTAIIATLGGLVTTISSYFVISNWGKIGTFFSGIVKAVMLAFSSISLPILGIAALIGLVVAAIIDLWRNSEEFRDGVTKAWEGLKDSLQNIYEKIIKPILKSFADMLIGIYEYGIKPLWASFKEFIKQIILLFADLWNALKPVVDWLVDTFGFIIVDLFKNSFNFIGVAVAGLLNVFKVLLDGISLIIKGIRIVLAGIIDFIVKVFSTDWKKVWEDVKSVLKNIMDSMVNVVKTPINAIIGFLNKMIDRLFSAFSTVAKLLNKMSFDVPDWVPGIGGETFGLNIAIPNKAPQIPMLANGGLIPPRQPRQVIVGDNMVEDEIVSPVSTIRDIIRAELKTSNGNNDMSVLIEAVNNLTTAIMKGQKIEVDGRVFGRTVMKAAETYQTQSGKKFL